MKNILLTWVGWLAKEIDAIVDEPTCPIEDPVAKNEKAIGTLDDPALRRMFVVLGNLTRENVERMEGHLKAHFAEAFDGGAAPACAEFHKELRFLEQQAETVGDLFWMCIRYKYRAEATGKNIGVRKDWTLVTWESKEKTRARIEVVSADLGSLSDLLESLPPR